ncbi:MAG TPA: helix-turn-helix transcriptional regulator [Actinophytocola sp.]|jgi:transcriptional regulator with XRE-family HTH domain|uniref:helix-turn-helix domain-containing protein n=1 Tax=Actinophytocola sp. TaxID=1872138 RepID=UPI002E0B5C1B|nr:helix-turn-helix transcriptional regulator [Actinophytocola sp.]
MRPRAEGTNRSSALFERQTGALGERVRAARTARGWSQQSLSNHTEIDRANISRIEGGKQNITLEVLWRLANVLQLHWADLLDDRIRETPRTRRPQRPFKIQLSAFGVRAYEARALQRISQQALADQTGIGRSTISGIEDGTQNITLETLSRLAAGLHLHWADLLDDRKTDPPRPAPR